MVNTVVEFLRILFLDSKKLRGNGRIHPGYFSCQRVLWHCKAKETLSFKDWNPDPGQRKTKRIKQNPHSFFLNKDFHDRGGCWLHVGVSTNFISLQNKGGTFLQRLSQPVHIGSWVVYWNRFDEISGGWFWGCSRLCRDYLRSQRRANRHGKTFKNYSTTTYENERQLIKTYKKILKK